MKRLTLVLAVTVIAISCFGQKSILPYKDGAITYSEIINLDSSYKKNDLYINAKRFFVEVFKSGRDVIQLDDKEAGLIIGKGYFNIVWKVNFMNSYDMQIWHVVKIYVKDAKYKYEITDFAYRYFVPSSQYISGGWQEGNYNNWKGHNNDKIEKQLDLDVQNEISKMKNIMKSKNYTSDF